MPRIYSNGPNKDFVVNPFTKLLMNAGSAYLAAPYFTLAEPILDAVKAGNSIQLIIGLNPATNPQAVSQIIGIPNLSVRFFTHRFHAKIYIFGGDDVLLGSSNLTDGGMQSNREAVIALNVSDDGDAVEEVRALFAELWETAQVLTYEQLTNFKTAWNSIDRKGQNPEAIIEKAMGRAEPTNINVHSHKKTKEQIFLQDLRRQVYEQYRPAFMEVSSILQRHGLLRSDFSEVGLPIETNRFLNWIRLVYAPGDDAWQNAALRTATEREAEILHLGEPWKTTTDDKVPEDYFESLLNVQTIFSAAEAVATASKEELTQGLLGIHAFLEQSRFVKGGESMLPTAFWKANNNDIPRVKQSLTYLLHGPGDFIQRLHDILYDPRRKLAYFGYFCALELFGTVKPNECPPLNGRMAKALRFLGYDVRPR